METKDFGKHNNSSAFSSKKYRLIPVFTTVTLLFGNFQSRKTEGVFFLE